MVSSDYESFVMKLSDEELKKKNEILKTPVKAVEIGENTKIADLVEGFKYCSVQARSIAECAEVFKRMLLDPERPTIFLGIAGPLIAAGLRNVLRNMIELNMVDVVVSTGAIIYQDIYQARGFKHYIGNPNANDTELRQVYIDRIYDTYVDEQKFWDTDQWIGKFADTLEPRGYSSREFISRIAEIITDENSIVKTAAKYNIPIFIPALNDSSIGIGLTDHYQRMKVNKKNHIFIDSIRDNYELTQIVAKSKKTAAIYIAGGVPKNFINDSVVSCYVFGKDTGGHAYAFQLTTDVPHWGGLSGSTLKEATSWGKISTKANYAMAFVEPSVSLPLIYGYALQRKLSEKRSRIKFIWQNDILQEMSYF